ncbi:MAG: hypothetical protein ACKVJE_14390 [Pseudomonadales bacterium]|jgi:hypothetical protein
MNLDALKEIITNNPEILEQSARDNNVDENTITGIALYAENNGYDSLTSPQKYHFDNCIRPLIEDVQCSSYTHEFEEVRRECPVILDDRNIVEYYQEDRKYCKSCEAQASSDAYSKELLMRD